MQVALYSIRQPVTTWLLMLACLLGGLWGFNSIGRLEDPAFSIKVATVATAYPGATAEEVAREVTEPLESAIQQMGEVDTITSTNSPGFSLIEVEMKSIYDGTALPAIWTDLRAKVGDAAAGLPSAAGTPVVNDGFGDVFGIYFAVTTEGYSDAERYDIGRFLRRELLTVDGVADVTLGGMPEEAIFVEPTLAMTVNQHVSPTGIATAIGDADSLTPAGTLLGERIRTRLMQPEGNDSVEEIAGLTVGLGDGEIASIFDIATVYRDRVDQPDVIIRHDGVEAFTLAVAGLSTENIVDVGKAVDAHLKQLEDRLPVGVDLHPIYQQHVVVEASSNAFLVNLAMSVAIVIVVLALAMGWRAALAVGVTLLLTVVGTIFFMAILGIEMERISLGALIIAMGMLVDNALVVAEGMQVDMQHGKSAEEAAVDTASKTQVPLLGATVIAIMAFAGIGLSPDATGEFLFSLFAVIGISLLLSWVLALTVTPYIGSLVFRRGAEGDAGAYDGILFRAYRGTLQLALRTRWLVVVLLIGITVACYAGFGQVRQQFFPDSNTPLFLAHYKVTQGTDITATADGLKAAEDWLLEQPEVVSVMTFAGRGAARFLLTYQGEDPNTSYGHLIIRTDTRDQIPDLRARLDAFALQAMPEAEFRTERLVFGPGGGSPIEVRFSGTDPAVLRHLAGEAMARLDAASDNVMHLRTDWRERELVIQPGYADDRAQAAGINREDVANALRFASEGITAGTYREGDRLIPITVRESRTDPVPFIDQVIFSSTSGSFVPVEQAIDGLQANWQDTLIHRRDRVQTITVQADIPPHRTAAEVFAEVQATIEDMELPRGYGFEWGGEHESSGDANESLGKQLPLSLIVMVAISVLLFNAVRQPLIIWLLVPMSVNGVALGLLGTGFPFTFTALLGLLSLSGMLIKNGIVLVEEIDLERKAGRDLEDAIVTASVSRLRPVALAAATTILGMAPLLSDAFFVSMAITIMGGLAFATVLTLIAAPVLYRLMFRPQRAAA